MKIQPEKSTKKMAKIAEPAVQDGFINVPVSKATREGLHYLKVAMDVSSQAEVIEKLVAMALAIDRAMKK